MHWLKYSEPLFVPPSNLAWLRSHAALPVASHLRDDHFRVYFSGRDECSCSHIAFFDFVFDPRPRVTDVAELPVLSPGPLGAFDDSGVTTSCVVRAGERLYHYYSGWSLGRTVPFYLSTGLAVSAEEGTSLQKVSLAPLMDRSAVDPYLTASPSVLLDGDGWRMWYVSGVRWEQEGEGARHYYLVKYAESDDGLDWRRDGRICIDFASPDEYAMGRPCVIRDDGKYQMWFCARGDRYLIAFAQSDDGLSWTRKDEEAGIAPSPSGWDSEMIAYPWVFDHKGERYMLYNGNGYGKTGVGLARLVG